MAHSIHGVLRSGSRVLRHRTGRVHHDLSTGRSVELQDSRRPRAGRQSSSKLANNMDQCEEAQSMAHVFTVY